MGSRTGRLALGFLVAIGLSLAGSAALPTPAHAGTPVTVRAKTPLNVRSGPAVGYQAVGSLASGARATVVCKVLGDHVTGQLGNTSWWYRLPNDTYASAGYLAARGIVPRCPPRRTPPAARVNPGEPAGTMSAARFVSAAAAPARRGQAEYGVPASVTIAQAILESGWGKSALARSGRNFFGMKCFDPGPLASGCAVHTTRECRPDGSCYTTEATFRTYASVTDSFRDHGRWLSTATRYRSAFRYRNNPDRFIEEIHRGGYATDPEYTRSVQRIMRQYQLYRYDLPSPA